MVGVVYLLLLLVHFEVASSIALRGSCQALQTANVCSSQHDKL